MKNFLRNIKNTLVGSDNYATKRKISDLLRTDSPVIVEAGAHIGKDSIEMSKVWPKGVIHAFEPVPDIYQKLVKTTKGHKNIITYQTALSDKNGKADLFVSSGQSDGSSSLLSPKEHISEHPNVAFDNRITISTITLDQWALQNRVDHVDFVWLDMQGYEFPVLKASETIFKTIKVIYTEVSLKEMYAGTTLYPEFKEWLNSQGFKVELEDLPFQDFGNVLFVKD